MTGSMIEVRVVARTAETRDICGFELVAADGSALPPFAPGAHIDVRLPDGRLRQYSLLARGADAGRPGGATGYLIPVLRDPMSRGGSQWLHDEVHEGDLLEISPPRNQIRLADQAAHHLLLAAGIGVAPILSLAEQLASDGSAFTMHYCARSADRAAFRRRITESTWADRVRFHFDDGAPAQLLDIAQTVPWPSADVHVYVCGPKGFMDAVLAAARARGWDDAHLHFEFFSAADAARFQAARPVTTR